MSQTVKKPATERAQFQAIHARCIALGVWRDEYEATARRLARIYVRISETEALMRSEDFSPLVHHTNKNGSTNLVKNPIISQLDTLYDQALAHERELALTPAALKHIAGASAAAKSKDASPFESILKSVMKS